MSFIHDALKKTQKNLQNIEKKSQPMVEPIAISGINQESLQETKKSPQPRLRKNILLRWLMLVIIIFIVNNLYILPKQKILLQKKIFFPKTMPVASNSLSQQTTPAPLLTLSGIMMIDNQYVALINNEIHHAGDIIHNGKIIEITLEKVLIELNGEKITLTVGQKY